MAHTARPTLFQFMDPSSLPSRMDDCGFDVDKHGITIYWGGYDYHIEKTALDSPGAICGWIAHISEKEWDGCSAERISQFIVAVYDMNGWGYPST